MNKKYKGAIVEESLESNDILKKFNVLETSVTDDENPVDRWHIHIVESVKTDLIELSKHIKPTKWYAHFWNEDREVIVIFRDKIFEFNYDDKGHGNLLLNMACWSIFHRNS